MATLYSLPCCGTAELCDLDNYSTHSSIIKEARNRAKGLLTAYFVKYTREGNYSGRQMMAELESYGWIKLPEFVNPNTGNTLQPMYYIIPKRVRKIKNRLPSTTSTA